jgi:hypothetical protein
MNREEILQCRDFLKSLGLTRWNGREWRFDDKLINRNYKIVYEYAGEWTIYTRTEVRKWDGKYELVTNSWIDFSGDFEEFKEKVNKAVDNYKKAAQKIKELKAQEDF